MADKEIYSLANSYPEMQGNEMNVQNHPDNSMAYAFMKQNMNNAPMKNFLQSQGMNDAQAIENKFRK